MATHLQFYIGNGVDPYTNLAIEKYLLDTVSEDTCILYLWQNQNTVVIGKNQNAWAECRCSLLESEGGLLARRLSGGGAVFHDLGNLNFTFLCSETHFDIEKQMKVIQTACQLSGIQAEISGRNDILAEGKKFSGNAFYHANGKAYHHGTLLISADMEKLQRYLTPPKAKLESKGVKSVKSRVVNLSELAPDLTCKSLKQRMISAFEQVYGGVATPCPSLKPKQIEKLAKEFRSWDFLYGSSIPFSVSLEERFSWGSIQLQLQVKEGVIQTAAVYTDAMDWQLAELITSALTNCPLQRQSIETAVKTALSEEIAQDMMTLFQKQEL